MSDSSLGLPQFLVKLEGEGEYIVNVRNGDQVRWDLERAKQKWPDMGSGQSLWASWVCWAASRRQGNFPGTWEEWLDRVLTVEYQETADEKADPTQKGHEPD
jgi:hypothetical protein